MNKGGVGVGSASIVLVFAVLCLTVFSLITFVVAHNDRVLAEAELKFVMGYYEADALAEQVLAGILESVGFIPETVLGVEIESEWDFELQAYILNYACPISDRKELYVKLSMYENTYDVLNWQMRDTVEWEMDTSLNVWLGFDESDEDSMTLWPG